MRKMILLIICLLLFMPSVYANSIEDKLNNISQKLKATKASFQNINLLDDKYPVGSIYITIDETNPTSILGGTWEAYAQGRTLIGMGSNGTTNYTTVNATNGSSTVTLATENLPSHRHSITASGSVTNAKFTGQSVTITRNETHTHTVSNKQSNSESTTLGGSYSSSFGGRIIIQSSGKKSTTSSSGSHYHTVTPTGTISSTFKGTNGTTSESGSSSSFSVQNPYITVYMWKRIA